MSEPTGRALDHVVLATRDLGRLSAVWEGMGFTLTPRASHDDRMGTSNRLAQFAGRTFIELLEVDRPAGLLGHAPGRFGFGAWNRDFLSRGEGLSMIVFRTDDAERDLGAWEAAGLAAYERFDFERAAKLPDGETVTVGFRLGFVTFDDIPDLAVFVCEQTAPEHFWKPAFQSHANRTQDIAAVVIASREPERDGASLAQLFDGAVSIIDGGVSVACGPHALEVLTPDWIAEIDPSWPTHPHHSGCAAGIRLSGESDRGWARPTLLSARIGGAFLAWQD